MIYKQMYYLLEFFQCAINEWWSRILITRIFNGTTTEKKQAWNFKNFFFRYSLILKNCGNILTFINQSSTKYNFHPIYYLTTLMQNMNMCVCVYMFSFFFFKIRWPWTFYLSCLVFIILCIHKTTVIIIQ